MPLVKTGTLCLLLLLCATCAIAQTSPQLRDGAASKPQLFRDLPRQLQVGLQTLAPLLQKEVGERVTFPLSPSFAFSGIVVSKSDAAETRYKTVVLKCTNRPGAGFTVSAIRRPDGSYRYQGQLLSLHHSDAYELVETYGRFTLEKRDAADLVSE